MGERLDEAKLELLRSWGDGLSRDDRSELKSAGRAILLLIEEIERLHVDLWHARGVASAEPAPSAEEALADTRDEADAILESAPELPGALRRRLAAVRRALHV